MNCRRTWTSPALAAFCCGLALFAAVFAGCSGGGSALPRFAVEGSVTLDGVPLESGSIAFVPDASTTGPSAGAEIKAGRYSIDSVGGPTNGKHHVKINSLRSTGKRVEAGSPSPPGTMVDEKVEAIPAKYNTKTTLTADVLPQSNTLDFQLESK